MWLDEKSPSEHYSYVRRRQLSLKIFSRLFLVFLVAFFVGGAFASGGEWRWVGGVLENSVGDEIFFPQEVLRSRKLADVPLSDEERDLLSATMRRNDSLLHHKDSSSRSRRSCIGYTSHPRQYLEASSMTRNGWIRAGLSALDVLRVRVLNKHHGLILNEMSVGALYEAEVVDVTRHSKGYTPDRESVVDAEEGVVFYFFLQGGSVELPGGLFCAFTNRANSSGERVSPGQIEFSLGKEYVLFLTSTPRNGRGLVVPRLWLPIDSRRNEILGLGGSPDSFVSYQDFKRQMENAALKGRVE